MKCMHFVSMITPCDNLIFLYNPFFFSTFHLYPKEPTPEH